MTGLPAFVPRSTPPEPAPLPCVLPPPLGAPLPPPWLSVASRTTLNCRFARIALSLGLALSSPRLRGGDSAGADSAGGRPAPEAGFDQAVLPFLQTHCFRCHGEKEQKGQLRIDNLSRDVALGDSAGHWGDVMYRISAGEMPPDDEPQPAADEAARVAEWLNARLKEGETARLARRERVTFHKLTREEYAHTIYDLLGVHYDATDPASLPEDPNWRGFERIGSVLSLSPAHVEKHFAAAEAILAEALPDKPPQKLQVRWTLTDFRGIRDRDKLEREGLLQKARIDVWAGSTFSGHPGSVQHLNVPSAGDYKIRIKLSGLKPPQGRAPHLAIYAADVDRMLFEQDVIAAEDEPVTLEFRTHFTPGTHVLRMSNEVPGPSNLGLRGRSGGKPFYSIKQGRFPWQRKLTDEDGQAIEPFLIVDWVEFEGPVFDSEPSVAQQQYGLPEGAGAAEAQAVLAKFVERAVRRPARPGEVEGYAQLMERELKAGENPASALRTAMLAVLCSKDFLYLVEGRPDEPVRQVDDWELAARLSYFLWSTMPDGPLADAARSGTLHQREVLQSQVRRMLADPRIGRFTDSFARQWLQLRMVGKFPPDKKLYPDYDDYLQTSMVAESTRFFGQVLAENLSLREFLDSNWTMLNARLAIHYGIDRVTDDHWTKTTLEPDDHRGGLLTQAAVLTLTSDGTRHRPVHRGKWLLESIIGRSPPPPPANVKPVEPTPATQPKATLRMKLAAHKSDANCAACHRKIDPLGFAFDNYDAIGRWRTVENVTDGAGDNPPVDASGELADGRQFADAPGLKHLLLSDLDQFNAAFVEKLATYALRRAMTVDDRSQLAGLAQASKAADYRLADIVEALILAELFQSR